MHLHWLLAAVSAYIQGRQWNGIGCHDRLSGFLIDLGKHIGTLQECE